MSDDDLNAKAQNLETEGERRYGEHWKQAIGAIGRSLPPSVNAADVVRGALKQVDPAAALFDCGRECLIAQASEGNHEAEAIYSKIRAEEREAHYARKGRVR
jgi:hypothetical protein